MITKFLINHNYEVHSAPNGRVGIDLCQKFLPGLIILDLTLPILNGDSLIKQSELEKKLRNAAFEQSKDTDGNCACCGNKTIFI